MSHTARMRPEPMRMFDLARLAGVLMAVSAAVPALALDGPAPAHGQKLLGTEAYASVRDALRLGVRDYNAGDKLGAVKALEYAATQGHALALWKLGRMYAAGDGVPQDDLRAFEYFSRIADDNADEVPNSPRAGVIASAFVSLGSYFLDGIKNSYVGANPERALELFQYAASYFGDPNAQYNLARLYLDGTGVDRDPRQAARWFNLAAEKGHHPAQALLGQLLVTGEGVPRQRARGLMWLTLAKESPEAKQEPWINSLYSEALQTATDNDRRTATAFLEEFQAKRR
jgi:TPR repeat protein